MERRSFVSGSLAVLAAPLAVGAQPAGKIALIGMLRSEYRPPDDPAMRLNLAAFREGLKDEGYIEGQHYRIDLRVPKTEADPVRLAERLVHNNADIIHAAGFVAIDAGRRATKTVPIVAHDYETDPVAAGFVASLARPGGNITGMFLDLPELAGKLLELLTTLPGLRRIGALWDPSTGKAQVTALEGAAKALGIEIEILEARAATLEQAVRTAADHKVAGLLLLGSPVIAAGHRRLAVAAAKYRLPSIGLFPRFARDGGLMAYGPDAVDQFRQEGRMVAKILKGAKPAELPVERPTKILLVINLKTARALGLTLPPSLLLRANEVIE
jgi:putative ABC transport system substrate-binding protein